ncbi:MAG: NCS2 family permease, partial [Bacteroidales bacterium]|nr:NCS2 family permease [Bacteroidales bacterium]
EGIIFLLLTLFNIRELIVNAIPINLKHAVSAGIGLFIAFIGLQNAGIIQNNDAVLVGLGDMGSPKVMVAFFGILVIGVLLVLKVKGALLIGMLSSTILALILGVTQLPEGGFVSAPPSLEPIFWKLDFSQVFSVDMLIVLFTFLFVDMFDTVGTLVGVAGKANMLTKEGKVPRVKQALFADAIGTTCGAILGTSTVTTYVESAAGVSEGGRSGLTSFTVAVLFLIALFFAPLFIMIPGAATAPALFMVGLFMISPILKINFDDYTESIPAFFTIIMMPLTYSIAEGIVFGMLAYVLLKLFTGKIKDVSLVMYVLAVLFILKFFM